MQASWHKFLLQYLHYLFQQNKNSKRNKFNSWKNSKVFSKLSLFSPLLHSLCICYILTTLKQQKTAINNISCKEDTDSLVHILVTHVLIHLKSNIQQSSDDILHCNVTKKYVVLDLFLFIIAPQGHSSSNLSILLLLLNTIFFRV